MSVAVGFTQPFIGTLLAEMEYAITEYNVPGMKEDANKRVNTLVIEFCVLAFFSMITISLQSVFLTSAGEHLTKNVRVTLYRKFLYNDVAFFDDQNNNPGYLTNKLAEEN